METVHNCGGEPMVRVQGTAPCWVTSSKCRMKGRMQRLAARFYVSTFASSCFAAATCSIASSALVVFQVIANCIFQIVSLSWLPQEEPVYCCCCSASTRELSSILCNGVCSRQLCCAVACAPLLAVCWCSASDGFLITASQSGCVSL